MYQSSGTNQIHNLIKQLEIPDCECDHYIWNPSTEVWDIAPACEHILDCDHSYPIKEWAELLLTAYPMAYKDRPEPPTRIRSLNRETRVELMRKRHSKGFALWSPHDLHADGLTNAAIAAETGRNGVLNRKAQIQWNH